MEYGAEHFLAWGASCGVIPSLPGDMTLWSISMDRKSLAAIAICFLILMGYPYFMKWAYPPSPAKQPQGQQEQQNQKAIPTEEPAASQAKLPLPALPVQPPSGLDKEQLLPKYEEPEEEFVVENDQMRVVLSNWGGVIRQVDLKYFQNLKGERLQLGSGTNGGWKTLQLLNEPTNAPWDISKDEGKRRRFDGVYKGEIRGRKVLFESVSSFPLVIRKTYTFSENGYVINAGLEIENKSQQEIQFDQGLGIAVGAIFQHEIQAGIADVSIAALDHLGNVWRKAAGRIKENATETRTVSWAALQNQYYAFILKPSAEAQGLIYAPLRNESSKVIGAEAALWYSRFKILPGKSLADTFLLYGGPKEYFQLKKFPDQFQKIIDFGMFSPICKGILYLLHYAYKPFHNYGIAILLLTFLIKILTHPLSAMSLKSMKRMQDIAPQINALKEKYKDNPQKMQKEMMGLYKENKVNPMGGCLPMLIQLPIFIALYTTLRNAIELKGASFLWIKDLSLPDTVAVVAGLPLNILPIIMGGTMIWQQKMSTVDPQQAKIMMFMPIFFTFIFYGFPSGLVLYWLVNNILSIIQQYQVQRAPKQKN